MTTFTYPNTVNLTSCVTTLDSPLLTVLASAAGSWAIVIGTVVAHANIPVGTTIIGFNSSTQVVMSNNATASGSGLTVVATNPSNINIDQISSVLKVGGDVYNINGPALTIDQDSRYGLNATTSTTHGAITISATLGGSVNIDGRYIRLIPFDTGSGTITLGETITCGSATGKVIGIYASLISAPTTSEVSGFIKIKQWNGISFPTSGEFTQAGFTFTITGADTIGWIDIVGDEAGTITIPRLGSWNISGEWYPLGVTSGNSATTYQIPTSGVNCYCPGVWVERTTSQASTYTWIDSVITVTLASHGYVAGQRVIIDFTSGGGTPDGEYIIASVPTTGTFTLTLTGSGTAGNCTVTSYEFYPNAGSRTAEATNFSTDWRSKVCWISVAGLITFQNDGVNTAGGYLPVSGLNIRLPNIFLNNCTTIARAQNALPNATIATRYETATTGGAVISIDKANIGWYLNMSQPYSVTLTNVDVFSNVTISELASPLNWYNIGIGQEAATAYFGLTMSLCFAGGTITDCTFTAATLAASGRYIIYIADIWGFTFTRIKTLAYAVRGNATSGAITAIRATDSNFNNTILGCGRLFLTTCTNVNINNTTYFDNQALNTTATIPMYAFDIGTKSSNITIDGLDFGGLYLTQPYSGILDILAAGCSDIKIRNLGTYASPLSLGSPRRDDQAWSRVTTVATITSTAHGLVTGDTIYVVVSSSIAAITVGAKTLTGVPDVNTFTFTCLNAGDASGTLCYFGTKCANLFVLATGAAANNVKIQRCYAPHTRTNLYTTDNSSKNITLENVFSDYLNAPLMAMLNGYFRNVSGTPPMTAQIAVYGTHWFNGYIVDVADNTINQSWTRSGSTITVTSEGHSLRTGMTISVIASSDPTAATLGSRTVTVLSSSVFTFTGVSTGTASGTLDYRVANGRIGLVMNEATSDTSEVYTFDSGAPNFTSAGGLFMPTLGDQITFITPIYILGQGSSFPIIEAVMAGGTLGNYHITYSLDKNDGNGYGAFHNLYYPRPGGSGSSGQYTFTVSDATGVEINDYIWGTNIAPNAKVTDINSNTITVDRANIGTISGIIRFNHLPYESGLGPDTGIKMKWRIKTMIANTTAITSLYINAESTVVGRAYQYPLDTVPITVTILDAVTKNPIENARVYLKTDPEGTVIFNDLTNSDGIVTTMVDLVGEDIIGRARKSTSGTLYKTGDIIGTIDTDGFETTILLIPDE